MAICFAQCWSTKGQPAYSPAGLHSHCQKTQVNWSTVAFASSHSSMRRMAQRHQPLLIDFNNRQPSMTVMVISLHIQHEHVTNKILESSILCEAALCSDDHVFHHVHVVHAACVTALVLVCEPVMYGNTPPQAVPGPPPRTVSKHDPEGSLQSKEPGVKCQTCSGTVQITHCESALNSIMLDDTSYEIASVSMSALCHLEANWTGGKLFRFELLSSCSEKKKSPPSSSLSHYLTRTLSTAGFMVPRFTGRLMRAAALRRFCSTKGGSISAAVTEWGGHQVARQWQLSFDIICWIKTLEASEAVTVQSVQTP